MRKTLERARGFFGRAADAGVVALAAGSAVGLGLDGARPGSAIHPHWMGSTGSPALDAALAGTFSAAVLLGPVAARRAPRAFRLFATGVGTAAAALSTAALARHLAAFAGGGLRAAGFAPPATLLALLLVVPWTLRVVRGLPAPSGRLRFARLATTLLAGLALVFAHVVAAGATDYRAPADAILVLGAKVNPDGRPSGALEDRVRTACSLRRSGLAPVLLLSGGKGANAPIGEPEAMRVLAEAEGVPDAALLLDPTGADTEASIRFAARLARERGWRRVLVVSHDYHLARVRLLAAREGLSVRTVPAEETHDKGWKVGAVLREIAAWLAAWVGARRG